MRILFSSDWQAALGNLDRLERVVDQVLDYLDSGTWFIHAGDVKDAFNPVDVRVTNFLIKAFTKIKKKSAGVLLNIGNHDRITTSDFSPSCSPWIEAVGIDCVAEDNWVSVPLAEEETSDKRDVLKAVIHLVPYFRDPDLQRKMFVQAREAVKTTKYGIKKILVFHNEIEGCEQNAYRKGSGCTLDDIGAKSYDLCIGGHIHRPQFIPPNVYFVGSPFACDWGEANESKRLLMVEI